MSFNKRFILGDRSRKDPFIAQNDVGNNFRDGTQENLTKVRSKVNQYDQPFTFKCPLGNFCYKLIFGKTFKRFSQNIHSFLTSNK